MPNGLIAPWPKTEPEKKMDVYYLSDNATDIDRHGEGHRCGLCNSIGKSYGFSFYLMDEEGWLAYAKLIAGIDEDNFSDWCTWQESQATYYGPSEETAKMAALAEAEKDGWIVLNHQGRVIYLTNGLCESTDHWSSEYFSRHGLGFQPDTEWGPYPLTKEEQRYICNDEWLKTPVGGAMSFGYTALYREKKWIVPTIEYDYGEGAKPEEVAKLLLDTCLEWEKLHEAFAPLGGIVLADFDDPAPYRFVLDVLIETVMEGFPGLESWIAHCRSVLADLNK